MQIRVGFEMVYEFAARTPVVLMLNVHPSRASDMIEPDQLRIAPALPLTRYLDAFGNVCTRLVAPAGELKISTDALIAVFGAIVLASTPAGQSLGSAFQAGNPVEAFGRLFLVAAASMSIALVAIVVMEEKPLQTGAEIEAS